MSGVVLRCPNCGTTRATPGLCEACHEADVRYYCTNHTPGLWLDTPTCGQCGARLGGPDRPPVAAPQPARTTGRPSSEPASAPRPRARPAGRPGAGAPTGRRDAGPRAEEEFSAPGEERRVPVTGLQQLLLAALQARRRRRPDIDESREAPPRTRSPGGCLMRFVLLMVFLFLAMMSGMFVFGSSLLRLFMPY
jgi:hypothetical protein